MQNLYVNDVLNYEVIENNYFTLIQSGVGSGKSTWAKDVAEGTASGQGAPKKVLFLTSRTIGKQDMLRFTSVFSSRINYKYGNVWLDKSEYIEYVYYGGYLLDEDRKEWLDNHQTDNGFFNQPVAQTYSYFVRHLAYLYKKDEDLTQFGFDWIWDVFDVLILDEVHTLLLEASFQTCSHTILRLVKWIASNKEAFPDKRVVFMSGTPEPILKTLQRLCGNIKVCNFMKKCKCVKPKEIIFIESVSDKMEMINDLWSQKHKALDFFNGKVESIKEATRGMIIPYEDILCLCSIWSDEHKRLENSRYTDDKKEFAKLTEAEEYIRKNKRIPEEFRYIRSTSAYAEAVSFDNEDIDYMFVDSHIGPRIVQCAGRLRKAEYTLAIVVNSYQYEDCLHTQLNACLEDKDDVKEVNEHFDSLKTQEEKCDFIEKIEEERDCIVFDYFLGKFIYFEIREMSIRYQLGQIEKWNKVSRLKVNCYHDLVASWFGDVPIRRYDSREHQSLKLLYDSKVNEDDYYSEQKIENLIKKFIKIWGSKHRINTYLKRFMPEYEFVKERYGNNKGMYLFRKNCNK